MFNDMATWEQQIRQESNRWFNGPPGVLDFYSTNMAIICNFLFKLFSAVFPAKFTFIQFWVIGIYGHRASYVVQISDNKLSSSLGLFLKIGPACISSDTLYCVQQTNNITKHCHDLFAHICSNLTWSNLLINSFHLFRQFIFITWMDVRCINFSMNTISLKLKLWHVA